MIEPDDDTPPSYGYTRARGIYSLLCWGIWWSNTCRCGETFEQHWKSVEDHYLEVVKRGDAVTDE